MGVFFTHPFDLLLGGDHLDGIGAEQVVNLFCLRLCKEFALDFTEALLIQLFATLLGEVGEGRLCLQEVVVVAIALDHFVEDLQVTAVGYHRKRSAVAPFRNIICSPGSKDS